MAVSRLRDGIVIDDEFRVVVLARFDGYVAHDRREVPRRIGECKWREQIEGLKNISLAGNERPAESGIEEIFLRDVPGHQLLG